MKTLHIIQRYPPAIGGSENWCRSLCEFSSSKGIFTKVATIDLYDIEEFHKELPEDRLFFQLGPFDIEKGVFVRRYKLSSFAGSSFGMKVANFFLNVFQLKRTQIGGIFKISPHSFEMYFKLREEIRAVDIVHLHTIPYFHNIVGFFLAKLSGKKIVITPHFHPGHPHYEQPFFYKMMAKCDAVIAMTEYEKKYLCENGVAEEKVYVSGNSIDMNTDLSEKDFCIFKDKLYRDYGINDEAKKIIFIGRKEMYKGIKVLIEAAQKLAQTQKGDVGLFLVGPGSGEFDRFYANIHLQKNLKVIDFGPVTDLEKEMILKCSDVLVLPSSFEAFGIVFLEAWKYSKPVVGSDRGAIPDVIKDAGLCSEHGNAGQLAERIETVLSNDKFSATLGRNGRKKLDNEFSTETINGKVLDVYRRLYGGDKRILIVSNLFPPFSNGGAEIVAYNQAKMLKKLGFKVIVFAGMRDPKLPRFAVSKIRSFSDIYRINLSDMDFNCELLNFEKTKILSEFSKVVYESAPDIVHFHNLHGLSVKMIDECKKNRIPTAITLHDYWFMCYKSTLVTDASAVCENMTLECVNCRQQSIEGGGPLFNLPERNKVFLQELNRIDLVISPSQSLSDRFIGWGLEKHKVKIINNGIAMDRFRNIRKTASKNMRFAYIGQISEHKGIESLIRAVSCIKEKCRRKMSLTIIGKGEREFVDYCKTLACDLNISDKVNFKSWVANSKIPRVFNNVDVLVVPSIWPENSPVTIMEALASGTPVVASRIGGIPELICEGVEGGLFEAGNVMALMRKMGEFIEKPKLSMQMREACRRRAERFDLSRQVSAIADCYNRLIEQNLDGYKRQNYRWLQERQLAAAEKN